MNIYLVFIVTVIAAGYIIGYIVETLNLKNASAELPEEFKGYYDAEKYVKSQEYLKTNTRFALLEEGIFAAITLVFILAGGFNYFDRFARGFGFGEIISGIIFAFSLGLAYTVLSTPFSAYSTFVIEERFGFNKTTAKIFIMDLVKSLVLGAVIGGLVFAGIIWFFQKTGTFAWLYCWAAVTAFELLLTFLAPVVIMPLFNKFIPLEDGELKTAVESYAKTEGFKMKGLFKMDGSKRSSKSNAFFTGFGKFRRIVLFDTLIERHTVDELTSVLAHEMGHYKKKHILISMIMSVAVSGLMFFILSFFMGNEGLFAAFRMENISVYAGIIFFAFLFSPINSVISVFGSILSRKHEYEADAYAVTTYKKPEAMINALKKLSVDNLSNLTPHWLKVFLEYSHPPVLERIKAIRNIR